MLLLMSMFVGQLMYCCCLKWLSLRYSCSLHNATGNIQTVFVGLFYCGEVGFDALHTCINFITYQNLQSHFVLSLNTHVANKPTGAKR